MKKTVLIIAGIIGVLLLCTTSCTERKLNITGRNPVIEGYYADPSVIKHNGTFYLYATIDPWGGDSLALFKSTDFENWEKVALNWPTKAQCKSEDSNDSMVWAPSVIEGKDGKFHMFVSVGSEVYAGISDHPEGPWKNVNADQSPFVRTQKEDNIHTIDAEAFLDSDGKAYLYWGSGFDWKNGHCLVAEMNTSMTKLVSEPQDITPANYFEAPYMIKKDGVYYLMYSDGKCTDSTYQVRYATSDNPYGPFKEGKNSPVLHTIPGTDTYGPGHHSVLEEGGKYYIVYHRIADPSAKELLREICADELYFGNDNEILEVQPARGQ
ncbi:family 43 glycosylhydrolase [Sinomicrobium oceani]|uniref:family 43 glycosylhydrolase n=1 Tax=Sinomicrobium oceani TaxID=1150368 RepID=UPI000930C91F|nr:family 43 glycosylhydrolase [Sinomicrobium oceani]